MSMDPNPSRRSPATITRFKTQTRIVVVQRSGSPAEEVIEVKVRQRVEINAPTPRATAPISLSSLTVQTNNRRAHKAFKRQREMRQQEEATEKRAGRIRTLRQQLEEAITPELRKTILAELSALGG